MHGVSVLPYSSRLQILSKGHALGPLPADLRKTEEASFGGIHVSRCLQAEALKS